MDTYNSIQKLIEKGHTSELYALINYDYISDTSFLSDEFLKMHHRKGPIPFLTSRPETWDFKENDYVEMLLLVVESATELNPIYQKYIDGQYFTSDRQIKLMDKQGRIWKGYTYMNIWVSKYNKDDFIRATSHYIDDQDSIILINNLILINKL